LKPNFGRSLFGQLLGRGIFFNFFFLGTSEPDFSQAFREHQARSIPTPYEPVVNFCSKSLENVIFFNFRGALS
jgi:hypothetical protein